MLDLAVVEIADLKAMPIQMAVLTFGKGQGFIGDLRFD